MQRFKDAIAAQTNYTILVSKILLCLIKKYFLPSNRSMKIQSLTPSENMHMSKYKNTVPQENLS